MEESRIEVNVKSVRAAYWVKHTAWLRREGGNCRQQSSMMDTRGLQEVQGLLVVAEQKTIQECELLGEERAFQRE